MPEHGVITTSTQIAELIKALDVKRMTLDSYNQTLKSSLTRLANHWSDAGFERYRDIIHKIVKTNEIAMDNMKAMIKYLCGFYVQLEKAEQARRNIQ